MSSQKSFRSYLILALVLLIAALGLSIAVGSVNIPLPVMADVFSSKLQGVPSSLDPSGTYLKILLSLRLPKAVLFLLAGAALAGSGSAYQGLFRNPLADPFLIGVSSGAGLGAVTAMMIRWPNNNLGTLTIPIGAFIGACLAVLVVTQLARVGKTVPTTNLILAGVAVSAFTSALTSAMMLHSTGELRRALIWLMGGSASSGWEPVIGVLPYMLVGLTGLLLIGHPLNVLQFGDEQAQQLGLKVQKIKWITVILSTMVTSAAVAFAGVIGFVGLVVPHIIRLLVGGDYRKLIPLSMLGGAILLLVTDTLARVVIAPQEIPVGIITSLVGAPFFLWVLKRSKSQNYW